MQGKASPLTYRHILYLLRRICPHGGGIQIDRDGNGAGSCALSKSFLNRFFWCFKVRFWRKLGVNVKSKCFIRWYDTNQIELTTMKTLGDVGLSDRKMSPLLGILAPLCCGRRPLFDLPPLSKNRGSATGYTDDSDCRRKVDWCIWRDAWSSVADAQSLSWSEGSRSLLHRSCLGSTLRPAQTQCYTKTRAVTPPRCCVKSKHTVKVEQLTN